MKRLLFIIVTNELAKINLVIVWLAPNRTIVFGWGFGGFRFGFLTFGTRLIATGWRRVRFASTTIGRGRQHWQSQLPLLLVSKQGGVITQNDSAYRK
jgi:hypothetical protein